MLTNRERILKAVAELEAVLDTFDMRHHDCGECGCKRFENYADRTPHEKVKGARDKLLAMVESNMSAHWIDRTEPFVAPEGGA
jgi:hypothetical protein